MRRLVCNLLTAASCIAWALPAAGQSPAQGASATRNAAPQPAGPTVALVDIVKVFENHPRFKQQMESVRDDIQSFERELGQQQEIIRSRNEQLSSATSETERRQIESDLTRQVTDLQLKAQRKKNEILQRESQIYYETYNEVVAEVGKLADSYGINLVLRYDSAEIVPHDRGSVLRGVTRPIVIQRNLDLTGEVVRRLGGRVSQTPKTGSVDPPQRGQAQPFDISKRIPFSGGYSN
jgi:Skp family chaperone for outer membrane proteins